MRLLLAIGVGAFGFYRAIGQPTGGEGIAFLLVTLLVVGVISIWD